MNSHILVTGLHCKNKVISASKLYEKNHLCYTLCIRNGLILILHVHQHLRMVMDEKDMTMRANWLRKKYMGVWRWGFSLMSRMMSRFPSNVVSYMARNRAKTHTASLTGWWAPGGGIWSCDSGYPSSCCCWGEMGNARNLEVLRLAVTTWSHDFSEWLCQCTDRSHYTPLTHWCLIQFGEWNTTWIFWTLTQSHEESIWLQSNPSVEIWNCSFSFIQSGDTMIDKREGVIKRT